MPYQRNVQEVIPIAFDVELHVSDIATDDGLFFTEIREYIPSLDKYSRGLTITNEVADMLRASL